MVGFENLEPSQNSFDQLCFNYWSEKVHHFYVQNTLAINFSDLEDESQQVENRLTVHSNVDITSEQEKCLQLFEDKPFGIFDLLTENGKVRSPNDEDFVNKLFSGNEAVGGLSRPNMGADTTNEYLAPSKDWRLLFIVQHHCGKVTYNGKGLSAKNALSISSTCAAIMQSSKNAVLHAVGAAQMAAASSEKAAKQAARRSTSSKFRNSMSTAKESKSAGDSAANDVYNQADALLHALNHTGKNFLVCIKPNEDLEEDVFDSAYVMRQIRDNHLVELMQAKSLLRSLSAIGVLEEEKFVVGKTKVYLTSHQWKKLEKARFLYLNACATMIQRNMLRGGFRKKSARLLYVMRGKRASEDIRVLNEGRQLIARLDEEEYVNSIIADATRIGHPALIEYAVRVAEKSSPWLAVDHLRRKSKSIVALQKQKTEKLAAVNKKLRASMIANDPEALMGSLATLEEPSVESLERKLATMMIIRALEEKSAVESVTHALSTIGEEDDDVTILNKLLGPATKAISLGVEAKLPTLVDTLGTIPTDANGSADEEINEEEESEEDEEEEEEVPTPISPVSVSVDTSNLVAALQKALDDDNFIAVEKQNVEKDAVAFNHFENLRGFNAQSERALAKKLCWESRAISQSLSVLDENSDEVPALATSATAGQMALSINRCILGYMRDRIVFYREMLAQYILQIGLMKPSLVDEIYLQLMKQLTKNPKRDSSIRGWSLFAMCATSFPPSLALQKYVIMFLKAQVAESNSFWRLVRNFAAYSFKKLENLLENGATGFIPSIDEIRGYEARPPFLATIQLLDGTPLADAFPVTPELTVSQLIEICSHFLGLEDHVVNFLGLTTISERIVISKGSSATTSTTSSFVSASNDGNDPAADGSDISTKDIPPPPTLTVNVFLGDIFEKELIRGREVRFVLKIRLNPVYMLQYTDEMYDRLVYIQVQDEIVKGNLPVMEEEALLRLTALAIAVDCEEVPPLSVEEIIEMGVLDYLPQEWRPAHDEEEWAELVLDTITDNLLDEQDALFPVSELQRIYIEEVTRHRLYGACFFPSKLVNRGSKRDGSGNGLNYCLGIELPNYFVIAVNGYGMHILGRDGSMLAFCEYADIAYCSGSYPQYKICLKKASDVSAPMEDIIITTKYSEELDALIADYKEITALMNEA
ncbi:Myosin-like protein [Phytophthora palmivora]|uniref:Myosin-like protein n=1 Tax=Phytophthora palmivora TaxID=4796 RepID=A0A2P4WYA7_9STRA|nr:Myosin-like protein [Phytophthora palmivora]